MLCRSAFIGMLVVSGCSTAGLDVPGSDMGVSVMVMLTGAVTGAVPAFVRALYNPPSAEGRTTFSILTPAKPGLGLDLLAIDALFTGMPAAQHYGERDAQISAGINMSDGRLLNSTVNSQNRIDLIEVTASTMHPDRSTLYVVKGTAAGSVVSSVSSDIIFFSVDF